MYVQLHEIMKHLKVNVIIRDPYGRVVRHVTVEHTASSFLGRTIKFVSKMLSDFFRDFITHFARLYWNVRNVPKQTLSLAPITIYSYDNFEVP